MYFIRNVYSLHADNRVEDAPAGVIAVNCGNEISADNDPKQVSDMLTSKGVLDQTRWKTACWQLGLEFNEDDQDHEKYLTPGSKPYLRYLNKDQILPDWQWSQIKNQKDLDIHEVDYLQQKADQELKAEQ